MARLDQIVGTADYNDIFAAATPTAHVATVKVAKSQGVLERGTIVTGTAGGELSAVSAALAVSATSSDSSVTVANPTVFVLAEDVDTGTTDAVVAIAYKSGNFRREALKTNGTYTMTDADWDYLRRCGILTTDSID